jgi:hypothetical protein
MQSIETMLGSEMRLFVANRNIIHASKWGILTLPLNWYFGKAHFKIESRIDNTRFVQLRTSTGGKMNQAKYHCGSTNIQQLENLLRWKLSNKHKFRSYLVGYPNNIKLKVGLIEAFQSWSCFKLRTFGLSAVALTVFYMTDWPHLITKCSPFSRTTVPWSPL